MSEVRLVADVHPFAPFYSALVEHRDMLVGRAMQRVRSAIPQFGGVPDELLLPGVSESVLAYADALLAPDFTDLRRMTRLWCESQISVGSSSRSVRELVEEGRLDYIDAAFDAIARGVPKAREAMHQLMSAFSAVSAEIDTYLMEAERDASASALMFQRFVDRAPDPLVLTAQGHTLLYANEAFREAFAFGDIAGRRLTDVVDAGDHAMLDELSRGAEQTGQARGEIRLSRRDGGVFVAEATVFNAIASTQLLLGQFWLLRDKGPLLAAEEEHLRLREEVIEAQAAAIRELSTPLLPIADGVLVMPLVGALTEARVEQMLTTLLEGISRQGARVAIVDITGVGEVDGRVAAGILQAARAAGMLGARVFLTGIRGAVAQALIGIDASFEDLVTCSTLKDGVARALRMRR